MDVENNRSYGKMNLLTGYAIGIVNHAGVATIAMIQRVNQHASLLRPGPTNAHKKRNYMQANVYCLCHHIPYVKQTLQVCALKDPLMSIIKRGGLEAFS